MPYIKPEKREIYDKQIDILINQIEQQGTSSGDVVYVVYRLIKSLYGKIDSHFEQMSNALKVLESAKLEFYRRIMAPFEDKKIDKNGDI